MNALYNANIRNEYSEGISSFSHPEAKAQKQGRR